MQCVCCVKEKKKKDLRIWPELLDYVLCPECFFRATKEYGEEWPTKISLGCYADPREQKALEEAFQEKQENEPVEKDALETLQKFTPCSEQGKLLKDAVMMLVLLGEFPRNAIFSVVERIGSKE